MGPYKTERNWCNLEDDWFVLDSDGKVFCECLRESIADEIVKKMNAHDDLVAALKEAKNELGFLYQGGTRTIALIDRIDAALAKAD